MTASEFYTICRNNSLQKKPLTRGATILKRNIIDRCVRLAEYTIN
jgi:hypothetical protein